MGNLNEVSGIPAPKSSSAMQFPGMHTDPHLWDIGKAPIEKVEIAATFPNDRRVIHKTW